MGDHAAALLLCRKALEIRRDALGETHRDYASTLHVLATLYEAMGDDAAALPLFRQAVEIRRTALAENHADYAASLYRLAALYLKTGDRAAALPLFVESYSIACATLGDDDPDHVTRLDTLATLYEDIGDPGSALPLRREALEIKRNALGEHHPEYAASLDALALLYQEMGDPAAALPICRQASDIRRSVLGERHQHYATSLMIRAGLYRDMGDQAAALLLCSQALEIIQTALGESHPEYATGLNNLAMLYQEVGDAEAALPLFRQALEIRRTALGEGDPAFANSLDTLATLYREMGDHAKALPLYRQALEIIRAAQGEHHPRFAATLNNLAMLYRTMGDHASALPLYRQALEIIRTALGDTHPRYATSLNNLAVLYVATDRASEALPLMEKAAAIDDRMIGQVLGMGTDRQRAAFLDTVYAALHLFLSLILQHLADSPSAVRAALDLVLRRKAIAAEAMATQRDAVLGGKYPALKPKLRDLAMLRMQIARETLTVPGPDGVDRHVKRLGEWHAQKERLEAELAGQIPEMNLEQKLRAADRRAVALHLSEGMALVEFVRFQVFDARAVPALGERQMKAARYIAFVVPGAAPDEVRMIDFGEAEPIDRMIADFRAGIIAEAETNDGRDMAKGREEARATTEVDVGLALRAALFDKLAPALGGCTRLLIAPDGDLTRLPFEVLPADDGRRLIDDYRISYLSCGRDVLRFAAIASGQPSAPMVLADPDFDVQAEVKPAPDFELADPRVGRRARALTRSPVAYQFHRLLGTRAEGERVATQLGVSPSLGALALEGRLKAECRSPRILHLATHGFFLPDEAFDPGQQSRGFGFDSGEFFSAQRGPARLWGPLMENPMLRSGLALAGANTWLRAGSLPEEAEDGLLTAEDVTGLDLLATELVVLSACETGLGQVRVGEGVFGLRRAFVLAGAKTLIMSLWKVPDEQTRGLMESFYDRLQAGEGRADALRQAQLALKAKYPDPFYWGAFICQGDLSPLRTVGHGIANNAVTG